MIKRISGFVCSVAVVATIVVVALGFGNYNSIFWGDESPATTPQQTTAEAVAEVTDNATEPAVEQDSLATDEGIALEHEEAAEEIASQDNTTTHTPSEEVSHDGE